MTAMLNFGIMGDVLLWMALSAALIQPFAYFAAPSSARAIASIKLASLSQFICVSAAFLVLMAAYVSSDFSLLNVVLNSHSDKPLIYKITGTWGNHEGSMLLWVWVLSFFGWLAGRTSSELHIRMLVAQGLLVSGLLLFIILTSSPFIEIYPRAPQGQGLNPLLQDIGLAIHPPMLYLGYVGYGIVFCFAAAGLWQQKIDKDWARATHPWMCASWSALTLGIGLGSWWAYRELGWGGWWFWDPVENVSLMPWLAGTALMHSNLCLMKRNQFAGWTALLAIMCFALSLMGTFIVRSGLLVSVHSFASDPERGVYLMLYMLLVTGIALVLFARFKSNLPSVKTSILSRDGLILVNNLFLVTATATILLAIIYPLILQALKLPSITVGPPYFAATFVPLTAPLVFLAALGPAMPWGTGDGKKLMRQFAPIAAIVIVIALLLLAWYERAATTTAAGVALGAWLLLSTFNYIRRARSQAGGLKPQSLGMILGHTGLAIFVIAATLSTFQKTSVSMALSKGQSDSKAGYTLEVISESLTAKENYASRMAEVHISRGDTSLTTLSPEIRYYPVRDMQTVEAAIDSNLLRDVYLSVGLQNEKELLGYTLHVEPAMMWLWFGFIICAAGGILSWITRRDIDKPTE